MRFLLSIALAILLLAAFVVALMTSPMGYSGNDPASGSRRDRLVVHRHPETGERHLSSTSRCGS